MGRKEMGARYLNKEGLPGPASQTEGVSWLPAVLLTCTNEAHALPVPSSAQSQCQFTVTSLASEITFLKVVCNYYINICI